MKKIFTKNFGMTKFKDAKHSLTFRTFLLILAGGIMMTACKKEENSTLKNENELVKTSWQKEKESGGWKLINTTKVENFNYDVYKNIKTGQLIYELIQNNQKTFPCEFDGQLITDPKTNKRKCELSGEECCNYILNDEPTIVVRPCVIKSSVSTWRLIAKGFNLNKIVCDVYENSISKQRIYVPQQAKGIEYNRKLARCGDNRFDCYSTGSECAIIIHGNTKYILVNPDYVVN